MADHQFNIIIQSNAESSVDNLRALLSSTGGNTSELDLQGAFEDIGKKLDETDLKIDSHNADDLKMLLDSDPVEKSDLSETLYKPFTDMASMFMKSNNEIQPTEPVQIESPEISQTEEIEFQEAPQISNEEFDFSTLKSIGNPSSPSFEPVVPKNEFEGFEFGEIEVQGGYETEWQTPVETQGFESEDIEFPRSPEVESAEFDMEGIQTPEVAPMELPETLYAFEGPDEYVGPLAQEETVSEFYAPNYEFDVPEPIDIDIQSQEIAIENIEQAQQQTEEPLQSQSNYTFENISIQTPEMLSQEEISIDPTELSTYEPEIPEYITQQYEFNEEINTDIAFKPESVEFQEIPQVQPESIEINTPEQSSVESVEVQSVEPFVFDGINIETQAVSEKEREELPILLREMTKFEQSEISLPQRSEEQLNYEFYAPSFEFESPLLEDFEKYKFEEQSIDLPEVSSREESEFLLPHVEVPELSFSPVEYKPQFESVDIQTPKLREWRSASQAYSDRILDSFTPNNKVGDAFPNGVVTNKGGRWIASPPGGTAEDAHKKFVEKIEGLKPKYTGEGE